MAASMKARFARDGGGCDVILSWDRLSHPVEELMAAMGPGARAVVLGDAEIGPVTAPSAPIRAMRGGWQATALIDHDDAPALWSRWEAAAAGMGAALAERRLVARELSSGALIAPLGFARFPGGFIAVRAGHASRAADAFIGWLAGDPPSAAEGPGPR